jgi:uncharacterized protein (TIGR03084 family)
MADPQLVIELLDDLAAESSDLDAIVAQLPYDSWFQPTPAAGWDVRDAITHLHQTDLDGLLALRDPEAFARVLAIATEAELDPTKVGHVDGTVAAGRAVEPDVLLAAWRADRALLADALRELPSGVRIPWFGPPMSVASFISARLMETWAHGQDVVDALGVDRAPTERLRHVAEIGIRARPFAYAINGLALPADPLRVELLAPGGEVWTWGPADAADVVSGPALDFCLLVTQRRHLADLRLEAVGPGAQQWLPMAQAFAGPPGGGREPLQAEGVA